jgi:hypothetical protein
MTVFLQLKCICSIYEVTISERTDDQLGVVALQFSKIYKFMAAVYHIHMTKCGYLIFWWFLLCEKLERQC